MNTRIITGIAIVVLLLAIIFAGNIYIFYLFIALNILGAHEISRLLSENRYEVYAHILIAMFPFLAISRLSISEHLFSILVIASVVISTIHIGTLFLQNKPPYRKLRFLVSLFYWGLPMSLAAHYFEHAHSNSNILALGVILLIWLSDTMAYFTGKRFGNRKLFPSISPNKTWEGSIGGGIGAIVVAIIYGIVTHQSPALWACIAVLVWILGTYGDLVESQLKRYLGVKDSGNILPGHGGILDRFDSLVMVIPFLLLLDILG